MFGGSMAPSLADIAAVTSNRNNDGFGDGNGWWVLIILFALFGGWGNGAWGGNGNGGVGAEVQRGFDTSAIITKLDGINYGICNLGYDQLAQMNGIGRQIDQAAFAAERTANNNAMFMMQQFNALSRQGADCCCETKGLIRDVQYNLEKSDCSIKTLVNQLFQQLQWGEMQNTQALTNLINQKFNELSMQQKDAEIANLRTQLANCGDQKTAQWIVNQLTGVINPPAVPAYPAANPRGMGNWSPQVLAGGWGYGYGRDYNDGRCCSPC